MWNCEKHVGTLVGGGFECDECVIEERDALKRQVAVLREAMELIADLNNDDGWRAVNTACVALDDADKAKEPPPDVP